MFMNDRASVETWVQQKIWGVNWSTQEMPLQLDRSCFSKKQWENIAKSNADSHADRLLPKSNKWCGAIKSKYGAT